MKITGGLAVAAALSLFACSSSHAKVTKTSTSGSPTPTVSVSNASVTRYANLVGAGKAAVDAAAVKIATCGEYYDPTNRDCNLGRAPYARAVQTLAVNLQHAAQPAAKQYIGPVPPQLTDLVARTNVALGLMKDAQDAVAKACPSSNDACYLAAQDWKLTQQGVYDALSVWVPYIH